MNTNVSVTQPNEKSELRGKIVKRLLQVVIQFLLIGVILFVTAGHLDWVWAWAYIGVCVGVLVVNSLVLPPELIAERGQPRENVKRWDKAIAGLSILPSLGAPIVAGLDERFGWSPDLALWAHLAALVLLVLGQGLFTWAMVSNKFFSTAVRIQMERDHTVATGGPYRYVRHPGYVGYVLSGLATSLALGSLWALVPSGVTLCLFVVRTALEDRTLQEELDGYKEYARRVRYRLLPGIW